MTEAISIVVSLDSVSPADAHNGEPFGVYVLKVSVLDGGNSPINRVPISMAVDGVTKDRAIDTKTTPEATDLYTKFEYVPQAEGSKTLVFTSEGLTKEFSVSVPNE